MPVETRREIDSIAQGLIGAAQSGRLSDDVIVLGGRQAKMGWSTLSLPRTTTTPHGWQSGPKAVCASCWSSNRNALFIDSVALRLLRFTPKKNCPAQAGPRSSCPWRCYPNSGNERGVKLPSTSCNSGCTRAGRFALDGGCEGI
jgi:hypothetical protein